MPRAVVLLVGLLVALLLVAAEPVLAQCAMCKTALTSSPEGQKMAGGFNQAILFLLAAPYVVFGALAASLWIARNRKGEEPERKPLRLS